MFDKVMKKAEEVALSDAKKQAEERQKNIVDTSEEITKLLLTKEMMTMDAILVLKTALNRINEAASEKSLKDLLG